MSTFCLYFFRVVGDATHMDTYIKMSSVTVKAAYSVFLVRKLYTEQTFDLVSMDFLRLS